MTRAKESELYLATFSDFLPDFLMTTNTQPGNYRL
jgi:hypothetical protein